MTMVYATTSLAYPKDYVFALRPICVRYVYCYDIILPESSISFSITIIVTMPFDVTDV